MPETRNSGVVLAVLLALATAMFGWMSWDESLVTSRPEESSRSSAVLTAEQRVNARLWEDPIEAVDATLPSVLPVPSAGEEANLHRDLVCQIGDRLAEGRNTRVHFLAVTVPATPFPHDVEVRLRLRYALQMAMVAERFIPEDRLHLGYVALPWPSRNELAQPYLTCCPARRLVVPYEWFSRRPTAGGSNVHVLTLWIREPALADRPLARVAWLYGTLRPSAPPDDRLPLLFLLGPRSSNTLKGFATSSSHCPFAGPVALGLSDGGEDDVYACTNLLDWVGRQICIYSPEATAPDPLLGFRNPEHFTQHRSEAMLTIGRSFGERERTNCFRNFIAPDDELMDLIAQELKLRQVKPPRGDGERCDRVLLLAEADTEYGRGLVLSFLAAWQLAAGPANLAKRLATLRQSLLEPRDLFRWNSNQVYIVRYLVGLDGKTGHQAGRREADKPTSASADELLATALLRTREQPVGESQLDYAERVAELLERQDLKDRDAGKGRLKAVGILGADVYDKLILLQAVRRRLPEAIFFTTDLDARLWYPDHLPFTRNVVVASAHDVSVPGDTRNPIPMAPFRDSYQTAVYLACQSALERAKDPGQPLPPRSLAPRPRLFEIGRNGPVALNLADPALATPDHRLIMAGTTMGTVLGELMAAAWSRIGTAPRLVVAVALLVAAGLLLLPGWRSDRSSARSTNGQARCYWYWFLLCAAAIAVSLLWLVAVSDARQPGGEPWAWTDGVSVWPTELLRLGTLFFAAWFLISAWFRHRATRQRLFERFIDLTPRRHEGQGTGVKELQSFLDEQTAAKARAARRRRWRFAPLAPGEKVDARTLFAEWVAKGTLRARYTRVIPLTVLYVASGLFLMLLTGGMPLETAQRGSVALWTDRVLLALLIGSFSLVLWYVLDTVLVSVGMLNRLAEADTIWPPERMAQHLEALGGGALVSTKPQVTLVGATPASPWIEGYLDVQFAAEKTQETARLIYVPFLIQGLMLLSRASLFDNWRWPLGLLLIFVVSAVLALSGSLILRRAATRVRRTALDNLERELLAAKIAQHLPVPSSEERKESATEPPEHAVALCRARRQEALFTRMRECLLNERRGAYTRFIQDPTLIAILLPTGMFGIVQVLVKYLFGGA